MEGMALILFPISFWIHVKKSPPPPFSTIEKIPQKYFSRYFTWVIAKIVTLTTSQFHIKGVQERRWSHKFKQFQKVPMAFLVV